MCFSEAIGKQQRFSIIAHQDMGGCVSLLTVSSSRSAGPSFMLNRSTIWHSFRRNRLTPSMSAS